LGAVKSTLVKTDDGRKMRVGRRGETMLFVKKRGLLWLLLLLMVIARAVVIGWGIVEKGSDVHDSGDDGVEDDDETMRSRELNERFQAGDEAT
jgi:hypothetical protein